MKKWVPRVGETFKVRGYGAVFTCTEVGYYELAAVDECGLKYDWRYSLTNFIPHEWRPKVGDKFYASAFNADGTVREKEGVLFKEAFLCTKVDPVYNYTGAFAAFTENEAQVFTSFSFNYYPEAWGNPSMKGTESTGSGQTTDGIVNTSRKKVLAAAAACPTAKATLKTLFPEVFSKTRHIVSFPNLTKLESPDISTANPFAVRAGGTFSRKGIYLPTRAKGGEKITWEIVTDDTGTKVLVGTFETEG